MTEGGKAAEDLGKKVEEGGRHAEKSGLSHRELRAAVHGLREEFPLLAQFAGMALHPIGLMVAAAASAFAIFKFRVDDAVKAMAGVELPEISAQKIGQVTAMAEAWKSFKDAFEGVVKGYNSVEAAADRAIKAIEKHAELQKKLLAGSKEQELARLEENKASMKPADYEKAKLDIEDRYAGFGLRADKKTKEDEIQAERDKARKLIEDADRKLREAKGIHVGSGEQDAGTEADLQKRAEAARAANKEQEEMIQNMLKLGSGEFGLGDIGTKLLTRMHVQNVTGRGVYGAQPSQADIDEAIGVSKQTMATNQVNIDRYDAFTRNKAAREEARKRKLGLTADAGREMGEASVTEAQANQHASDYAEEADVNREVAGMHSESRMSSAIAKANQEYKQVFEEILKQMHEGHRVSADMLNRLKEVEATQRELMKRANDHTPPI